jgi:Zn-dependent protease
MTTSGYATIPPMGRLFIHTLTENPVYYFSVVIAVVISVVLHELGHAFAAIRQGDDTPRLTGHVTLDPIVHMGVQSLIFLFLLGIAWGATPVNPSRFRGRYGHAIVAWSGPAVNLVLAGIGLLLAGLTLRYGTDPESAVWKFLLIFGTMNVVLFLLNLIPIPPFDGSSILADISPGYAELTRNPGAQPFFLGALILVFVLGGRYLFAFAGTVAERVLSWIAG